MKLKLVITLLLAFLTLYFFPSPEQNFIWYALTALFFLVLIIFFSKRIS